MKAQGSICVCGYVHSYALQTSQAQTQGPYRLFSTKDGHVISSSVHDFAQKFPEAESKILEWIHLGKLKYREILFNGFERLPDALTALYDGRNVGKIIVKSAFAANLQTMVVNV
ncbi:unnamed protein product [Lymnaea stagnalis]|uniref:Uncharacterized protein n=1 Tax=Lymnaea stagnalis TaxID=6523 RepID=A0AAV2H659_LYMST